MLSVLWRWTKSPKLEISLVADHVADVVEGAAVDGNSWRDSFGAYCAATFPETFAVRCSRLAERRLAACKKL